ncbi:MAG: glutamate-5-semialdehyde dehydrogenase [Nitrospirales bacterium]|nr:glutamate-5-semialdehyde dehydrogenase [Nitrospirales bacterium]
MVEIPLKMYVQNLAKQARESMRAVGLLSGVSRVHLLFAVAEHLDAHIDEIFQANRADLDVIPKDGDMSVYRQALERVRLTDESVKDMITFLRDVAELPDPIGEATQLWNTVDGLQVRRVRIPLGVIGVISEMAPRVLIESFALCLKSGNVCLYRGGREWEQTNAALAKMIHDVLATEHLPSSMFTFIDRSEPEGALELCRLTQYVNAIVPRGKGGLRKAVMEQSRVPVLGYDGSLSHVYIDGDVDLPLAQTLVVNSKVQDPEASNAVDTVLVHQAAARKLLPGLLRRLLEEWKVDLFGCPQTISIMGVMEMTGHKGIHPATDKTWKTKFQSLTLAVKVVNTVDEAIEHITQDGPGHTDTIVTRDYGNAMQFVRDVNSSAVFVNASTRLHSGPGLELGPELGMNTTPFQPRGPLTLKALTSEKFVGLGVGHLSYPHPVPQAYEDAMMMSPKF